MTNTEILALVTKLADLDSYGRYGEVNIKAEEINLIEEQLKEEGIMDDEGCFIYLKDNVQLMEQIDDIIG